MSRDFRPPVFFLWFEHIWASDKQAKVFSKSVLILLRYSITKFFLRCAVCNTPLRISQRCAKYHRDHLHSVQHTTAYHTAYRGDHLSGVQHTAESRVPNLKKSPGRVTYRGDDLCAHHRDDISGVPHTAEINSALCNTPQRQSPWCATYCGVNGSKF